MDKKELVIKILTNYGCLTAAEVSSFAKRKYNETISPQSASGTLRSLAAIRAVGYSGLTGKTVYWLNKED